MAYDASLPLPPGVPAGNSAGADDSGFYQPNIKLLKSRYDEELRLPQISLLLPAGVSRF